MVCDVCCPFSRLPRWVLAVSKSAPRFGAQVQGHAVVREKAGAIAGPPLLREGPAAVPGQAEGERMDFETVPSAGHAVPLATVHSLLSRNLRKHREQ